MTKRPPSAATLFVASFALTALAIVGHAPSSATALVATRQR